MTMDISADNPEQVPAKVRDCSANVIEQCPGLSRAAFRTLVLGGPSFGF